VVIIIGQIKNEHTIRCKLMPPVTHLLKVSRQYSHLLTFIEGKAGRLMGLTLTTGLDQGYVLILV